MTISDQTPLRLLPMSDHVRGKRSAVTCQLEVRERVPRPRVQHVGQPALPRHRLGRALAPLPARPRRSPGAIGLASSATPPAGGGAAVPRTPRSRGTAGLRVRRRSTPSTASSTTFTVPAGYTWQPIIRWGDPLFSSTPALDFEHQTPEAQAGQFGYNSDYLDIIADPSGKTGVLVNNHEYVNPNIMFPPTTDPAERRPPRRHLQGRPGHVGRRAAAPQGRRAVVATSSTAGATAASRSRRCSSSPAPPPAPTS